MAVKDFDCDRFTETNGYFAKMSHAYKSDSGVQYVSQKKIPKLTKLFNFPAASLSSPEYPFILSHLCLLAVHFRQCSSFPFSQPRNSQK